MIPKVLDIEQRLWTRIIGVEDCYEYKAGTMSEQVPTKGASIHEAVLRDWSNVGGVRLPSNKHDAAPAAGRLFVGKRIPNELNPDPATIDLDRWMMLETGGQERIGTEFDGSFERSG